MNKLKKLAKRIIVSGAISAGAVTAITSVAGTLPSTVIAAETVAKDFTGSALAEDGSWKFYRNGSFDSSFTGLALSTRGNWIFMREGVYDKSFTGIAQSTNGNWLYVKNGRYSTGFSGVAQSTKGNWLYVKNGRYNTGFSGVAIAANGKWMYVKNGRHDPEFSGIAKSTKGNWLYVKNGIYNTAFSGIAQSTDGKWLYVKNGRFLPSYSGIALSVKGNWLYVKNGEYDASFTGIAQSTKGNWLYVKNGRFSKDYTGVAESTKGNKIYVKNGRFDNTFTGISKIIGTDIEVEVKSGRYVKDVEESTVNEGWVTKGGSKYYYQNGESVKGIQKIDNKWYEFDKSTGVYTGRESDNIYLATYFQDKKDQMTRYYVTLDGKNLTKMDNAASAWRDLYRIVNNKTDSLVQLTRDSTVFAKNGRFFTFFTAYSNNNTETAKPYDFAMVETQDFLNYAWRVPDTYAGSEGIRWAPDYFEDDNGKLYVFYAVAKSTSDRKKQIYMTECLDYSDDVKNHGSYRYKFTTPVKINLKGVPSNLSTDNMIDANVFKKGSKYYMVVKREFDSVNQVQSSLMIFNSTDLKNWNYYHNIVISDVFPKNGNHDNYRAAEGPCITEINGTYYLYVDLYDTEFSGTTDPSILNKLTFENKNDYMGIHYATSTDLKNWKYGGIIKTSSGEACRHGSIVKIKDEASEKVIQTIFNGGTVEIPKPVTLKHTGEFQSFFNSIDSAWDSEKKLWVFTCPFFYAYSKEPKDARDYEVTLVLKDKNTLKWSDGTTTDKTITCTITK